MEFKEFRYNIIHGRPESEGLEYFTKPGAEFPLAARMQRRVVSIGDCQDTVIHVPGYYMGRYTDKNDGLERFFITEIDMISYEAFKNNKKITDVILSKKIRRIDDMAFYGCCELRRITIPKWLRFIGYSAFEGCDKLEDVYYEGTQEEWEDIRIRSMAVRVDDNGRWVFHEDEAYDGNSPLRNANIHFNCRIPERSPSTFREAPHNVKY